MPRILVVEDDGALRFDVVQTLLEWKFEVESAPNAVKALRIIKEWRPHLVLCDIFMPHVTGFELKRQIDKFEIPATEMRFIFMTQLHQSQIAANSIGLGSDGFVSKPLDYDELRETVVNSLRKVVGLQIDANFSGAFDTTQIRNSSEPDPEPS